LAQPQFFELILGLLTIIAAIVTVRATNRLSAIISIGVVGVTVTLAFVIYGAPDLALTQLLIEVLTVVLLVLVFYKIPPRQHTRDSLWVQFRNLFVALAVGCFGFALVLVGAGTPFQPAISDYFALNAVAGGHGGNVVNVILVDFRGFDTMGEISVLVIAAMGGYALLRASRLRVRAVQRTDNEKPATIKPTVQP
jgi:multicomponent Na+:H+ antiporter subunit A